MAASTSKPSKECTAYHNQDYWQTNSSKNNWSNTATNKANWYLVFGNTTHGQYNSHWSWMTLGWNTLARNTPSISKTHSRNITNSHAIGQEHDTSGSHLTGTTKNDRCICRCQTTWRKPLNNSNTSPANYSTHLIRAYQFNMAPRSNTQRRNWLHLC